MKYKRIFFVILVLSVIIFIFSNSMLPAIESRETSKGVMVAVVKFLKLLNITPHLTNNLIRKSAHFIEFFFLAILLYVTQKAFGKELLKSFIITAIIGLIVATVDETIQLFFVGRSCQISDILLDFMGVLLGLAFIMFVEWLKKFVVNLFK